ncbi:hypothetical protein K458DRAFT_416044 [Lentithecium fluviatile CBS 122367]|uniref:F-box domain-containing protein n=1 Tax=Lentithecium fluviatile CBS 122367 TaxID=1168545 RepID=A0A6G1J842_9PLEO|nr:hypothetical protein K458DRAFT_416044 [Lentithecium fluviatile CBS 122367]
MPTSPLIALPAELRLRVYDFVIPPIPLSAPPSGLLSSCNFIRQELEHEILKRMAAFLLDVQARCRRVHAEDMDFSIPQNLGDLFNFHVSRPNNKYSFTRIDPFMALMYMHFNTLYITATSPPDFEPSPFRVRRVLQSNTRNLCMWMSTRAAEKNQPAANRIVYDWSHDPQTFIHSIKKDCWGAMGRKEGWGLKFRHQGWKEESAEFVREEVG